ncbi:TetR family transcriptional regulator [Intrasporangium chromatireducens Q5-1]|uniref:TetR family transcriptional regulator n=1 Tax=Intrasporangium chromatireducens Q5-1 TaxID=584657 RepID=W9GHX0_9MICO|nr:TetR/AcrR family transcriptional regulator [Intrasporangium chromatireducens]EWT05675.1 TetR family transcriptional regulator [Intrasporangium chromatireducens Q5-1]
MTATSGDPVGTAPLTARTRARRDEVLADLRTLFLAEGFADLTIADLAERLHCSRSTLYLVAGSKEQIVVATVRSYFKTAAASIERRLAPERDPVARLRLYLDAVAEELSPASPAFHRDVAAFPPAREVYRQNTGYAAQRVRALIDEGVAAGRLRQVDAAFVGAAAGEVMTAIQRGAIAAATGLDDAAAYRQLADLLVHGLAT